MAAIRALALGVLVLALLVLSLMFRGFGEILGAPSRRWLPRLICTTLLGRLRIRVETSGEPGPAGRLIVANHVSWIDILVLGSIESPCFLAKREVASWPVIGTFAKSHGTVFVDRVRRRLLPQVNRAMAERLRQQRSVLLFPEGTTQDGSRRGAFLTSHLACLRDRLRQPPDLPSCAVQAAALAYSDPFAAWVGDQTLVPHLWAVLKRPPMVCRLLYGDVRTVEPGHDRKALGRLLRADVEALLRTDRQGFTSRSNERSAKRSPRQPNVKLASR